MDKARSSTLIKKLTAILKQAQQRHRPVGITTHNGQLTVGQIQAIAGGVVSIADCETFLPTTKHVVIGEIQTISHT